MNENPPILKVSWAEGGEPKDRSFGIGDITLLNKLLQKLAGNITQDEKGKVAFINLEDNGTLVNPTTARKLITPKK